MKRCDRCTADITTSSSFLTGNINIAVESQVFRRVLKRNTEHGEDENLKKHKAMISWNGHQQLHLAWGKDAFYNLCVMCQDELLATIGEFFNFKDLLKLPNADRVELITLKTSLDNHVFKGYARIKEEGFIIESTDKTIDGNRTLPNPTEDNKGWIFKQDDYNFLLSTGVEWKSINIK